MMDFRVFLSFKRACELVVGVLGAGRRARCLIDVSGFSRRMKKGFSVPRDPDGSAVDDIETLSSGYIDWWV